MISKILPDSQMMRMQVIKVVGAKLLKTAAGHVHQLDFHFRAGLSILRALHDVLLPRASRLHHLVHRAVAVGRQEAAAELHCQLIHGIALAIEVEILPHHGLLQHLPFRFALFHFHAIVISYFAKLQNLCDIWLF